jgi:hypothetical protein
VADRKPFLLRIDRAVLDAVQRWANDDLRSLNGQIEFLLRDALRRAGRSRPRAAEGNPAPVPPGTQQGAYTLPPDTDDAAALPDAPDSDAPGIDAGIEPA